MSTLLENLPNVTFAEKDPAVIEAEVISRFEEKRGRRIHPGDPWFQTLLSLAKYMTQLRGVIDFAGKQNLLKYAGEGFLQNLAALLAVEINEPTAAVTKLEFTLSMALPSATTIPANTRATPGNDIYFATAEAVDIPAGETSVEVNAVCTQVGVIGNGYLPGQVSRLVDTFAFNYSVRNVDVTQGGADREDLDAFRERVRLAPESFSTAGPNLSYVYWAKTANQLIVDVSVKSPEPGVVEIIPLLAGGEIPSQAILDEVYAITSADNRRPLTDYVIVREPETVNFGINFTYFISRSNAPIGLNIQQRVQAAVAEYVLWQKSALGRDINPSQLTKMLMKAGIKRVEVNEPEFTVLQHYEIGVADPESILTGITYGGLEDD